MYKKDRNIFFGGKLLRDRTNTCISFIENNPELRDFDTPFYVKLNFLKNMNISSSHSELN